MGLNNRMAMHPQWPFHQRPIIRGFMRAVGTLYKVTSLPPGDAGYDLNDPDPAKRVPRQPINATAIYTGPVDIEPNQAWRARKINWRDETMVEHAYTIQLSFHDNQIAGTGFPVIKPGNVFKVTSIHSLNNIEVDPNLDNFQYIVRNVQVSSNSWYRELLCDNDVTKLVTS